MPQCDEHPFQLPIVSYDASLTPMHPPPPLIGHSQAHIRAAALAYRAAMVDGLQDGPAAQQAAAAFIAAGGDPETAVADAARIIARVSSDHGDWLWRPVHDKLEREKAAMQQLGWWPGPLAWDERRRVADEAVRRVFGCGMGG